MSTKIGRDAENAAANYLTKQGLSIVAMNWRTRQAEIDIIATSDVKAGLMKKQKIIHFIEVKYRKTNLHGDGLEYITKIKQSQIVFAASQWVHEKNWEGDYQIDAIAVTGDSNGWSFDYRPDITN